MGERVTALRSFLLRRYYQSAVMGWSRPIAFHWVKVVTEDQRWRWVRVDTGIRGRLLRHPPVHIYQTVLGFRTDGPPRGVMSQGHLLMGPLLFECDLLDKGEPFSLWRIMDGVETVKQLIETVQDRGDYRVDRVVFSGSRGLHVLVSAPDESVRPIPLVPGKTWPADLSAFVRERKQTARSIGRWCEGWDWTVSADIWRVARVPWSMHGGSALRAVAIKPPYTGATLREQLKSASPFSFSKRLRTRIVRPVPLFTFVDGETYGPFHKGWTTRVPIAVALHLIWLGLAKPREAGPSRAGDWFERGWQILFRSGAQTKAMAAAPAGGGCG